MEHREDTEILALFVMFQLQNFPAHKFCCDAVKNLKLVFSLFLAKICFTKRKTTKDRFVEI